MHISSFFRISALIFALTMVSLGACDGEQVDDDDVADDDDTGDDDTSDAIPPCSGGTWGSISDPDRSIHVRADGSDETGDGSATAPLATLATALLATRELEEDKRIAVGPGVFDANLSVLAMTVNADNEDASDTGLVIEGCSTEETALVPVDESLPVIKVTAAQDIQLAGFSIDGGRRALWIWGGATATVDFVTVRNSTRLGVIFGGWHTIVTASNLVVEDTQQEVDALDVEYGYGISIQDADVEIVDSSVSNSRRVGILIDFAQVALDNVTVDGTQASSDGALGRGIQVQDFSTLELYNSEIGASVANSDAGVFSQTSLWLQIENVGVHGTGVAELPPGEEACSGEGCPGDGIVINQAGEINDPAFYTNNLYDNTVAGSARAGIIVDSVAAEIDGNTAGGDNGVVDGVTGESIFVQGDLIDDDGQYVIEGGDSAAERADSFQLNLDGIETDQLLD
jgi:hypothetical protein